MDRVAQRKVEQGSTWNRGAVGTVSTYEQRNGRTEAQENSRHVGTKEPRHRGAVGPYRNRGTVGTEEQRHRGEVGT